MSLGDRRSKSITASRAHHQESSITSTHQSKRSIDLKDSREAEFSQRVQTNTLPSATKCKAAELHGSQLMRPADRTLTSEISSIHLDGTIMSGSRWQEIKKTEKEIIPIIWEQERKSLWENREGLDHHSDQNQEARMYHSHSDITSFNIKINVVLKWMLEQTTM